MTENQWPQDGSYASSPTTQRTQVRGPEPGQGTDPSTVDTIKDEAGIAAEQAKESATKVVETAKTEAATVAEEVKMNARDLVDQARLDLTDQAARQQQKVASGLRSISEELYSMADASEDPGVATDLVRQAAERSSSVAAWLDGREPGAIVDEVKGFARRRPGAFLLMAAGAGVLAGRLGRSLGESAAARPNTAGRRSTGRIAAQPTRDQGTEGFVPAAGMTVPPPPVQLPGPHATTAGYNGGVAANEGLPPAPAYADPVYGDTPESDLRRRRDGESRDGVGERDPDESGPAFGAPRPGRGGQL